MKAWPRASRRATEITVGLVALMLVAGVIVGVTIGTTSATDPVRVDAGLPWVPDPQRGEALQVNPDLGREENRITVADAGQDWQLTQADGWLVVTLADGTVTVIDIGTLTATGRYAGAPATKVLLGTNLYAVDRTAGTITRLDPATAAPIPPIWRAGGPLADASIDDAGTVWALQADARLHRLEWTASGPREAEPARRVDGAGARSVLVPHEQGVTVFASGGGTVVRVGTTADATLPATRHDEVLLAAPRSPADLAAATVAGTATLVLVASEAVLDVDVAEYGCRRPARPAVHAGQVYVPCEGTGRVLVVDRQGRRVEPDLLVGETGTAILTVHNGLLFATLPSSSHGLLVHADGSVATLTFDDTPGPPAPVLAPPPPTTTRPPVAQPPGGQPPGGQPPGGQPPGPSTTITSDSRQPLPPAGASVVSQLYESGPTIYGPGSCLYPPGGNYCYLYVYNFSIALNPPASWSGFTDGSCSLRVWRGGSSSYTDHAMSSCAQTDVYVGESDGSSYTVSVVACRDAACVESGRETFPTTQPNEYNCGASLCQPVPF